MWIVSLVDKNCTVYVVDSGGRESLVYIWRKQFTVFVVDQRCIVSVVNKDCTIHIAIIHNSTKWSTLKQTKKRN